MEAKIIKDRLHEFDNPGQTKLYGEYQQLHKTTKQITREYNITYISNMIYLHRVHPTIWRKEIEKRGPRSLAFFCFYNSSFNLRLYFFSILNLFLPLK